MSEDYYAVLGVNRSASQADIQKAYRDQARKFHPDMNPDDSKAKEKFQRIQQAYEVLNNPEKREMYDRYGSSFEQMGAGPQGHAWAGGQEIDLSQIFGGGFGGAGDAAGFEEILRQFGGGARGAGGGARSRSRRPRAGANLEHEVQVPFQTAVLGGKVQITVARASGKQDQIEVNVPAGIADGKKIRVRGQGEPGLHGGPAGDILITVRVATHACFRRKGNNLEVSVPISLGEAVLGAKIDVPTPSGTVTLTVPPGSSSGRRLRVRGMGVKPVSGEPGDLFAVLEIVLPEVIDDASRKLIEEFQSRNPQQPRGQLKW